MYRHQSDEGVDISLPKGNFSNNFFLSTVCFKTVLGHTSLIPESMQEEYLEDLWQWALSEYEDKSKPGLVLFPPPLVIHARKPVTSTESNK